MNEIAVVHVTFADAAEAERIGSAMVAERLAACVTVGASVRSIFRWKGAVDRAHETPATFKTSGMIARRLVERIAVLHSYDVPVIELTVATVDPAVVAWVDGAVG